MEMLVLPRVMILPWVMILPRVMVLNTRNLTAALCLVGYLSSVIGDWGGVCWEYR
ncbi:hypothetical protein DFH29DRAFT_977630 [Suillus ampliporus]|nr:hypothetical protein DFH29DRAFT_977630 [Suillus ampliporus]